MCVFFFCPFSVEQDESTSTLPAVVLPEGVGGGVANSEAADKSGSEGEEVKASASEEGKAGGSGEEEKRNEESGGTSGEDETAALRKEGRVGWHANFSIINH